MLVLCSIIKGKQEKSSYNIVLLKTVFFKDVRTSKGGENSESKRHTGCCFVLLALSVPRLKTR